MVDGPVGFIGTGNIGAPMATNLVRAGFELRVFDLDPARIETLVELGAEPGGSVLEIAETCPTIVTSLPGPPEVEQVLLGDGGVLEGAREGTIHVDLSTNLPSVVQRLAAAAAERGVVFLDAPVSGGVPRAREGTLAVMVGGDAAAFETCRPLFEAIGDHVFHMGESGRGSLVKLVNNMVALSARQIMVEGLALARSAGLDPKRAHEVMSVSSAGRYVGGAQRLLDGEFDSPTFTLRLARKDLGLAMQVARDSGLPTPLLAAAHDNLSRALGAGHGELGPDAAWLVYAAALGDEA
jgi:3-hydroxyisobutyrate dehydrogenase-like beta-hydroxyacid dehydrogenase